MPDVAEGEGSVVPAEEFEDGVLDEGVVRLGVVAGVALEDDVIIKIHIPVAVGIALGVRGARAEVLAEDREIIQSDGAVVVEVGGQEAVAEDGALAVRRVFVAFDEAAGVIHHAEDVVVGVLERMEEPRARRVA